MDKPVIGSLVECRRDALLDYYRGQVAADEDQKRDTPLRLTTINDVYEYLLMDTQVSSKVDTSRLAEAIACLQQYIGAIYAGMEPGHDGRFSEDELEHWHKCLCNISDWAGYKALEYYPENYISPTLRLKKSDSFKELENNIGQASLSDKAVQMALYEHLKKFEEICNLRMIAGYMDSLDGKGGEEGNDFKNATYYFIGQQRVPPHTYFWRKVRVELNQGSTYLNPAAWREWQELGIPSGREVLAIRLVFFAGRLNVVFVEGQQGPEQKQADGSSKPGEWAVEIKCSFLAMNGMWSTPLNLEKATLPSLDKKTVRLVAVTLAGTRRHLDDTLLICLSAPPVSLSGNEVLADAGWLYSTRNIMFDKQTDDVALLQGLVNSRFNDKRMLQHKIAGGASYVMPEKILKAPVGNPGENDSKEGVVRKGLDVDFHYSVEKIKGGGERNVLKVKGSCDAVRNVYAIDALRFGGQIYREDPDGDGYKRDFLGYVDVVNDGADKVVFTCRRFQNLHPSYYLYIFGERVGTIESSTADEASETVSLSLIQIERLLALSKNEVMYDEVFAVQWTHYEVTHYESLARLGNSLKKKSVPEMARLSFRILTEGDDIGWSENRLLNGELETPWIAYPWEGSPKKTVGVVWGGTGASPYGRSRYDIAITNETSAFNVPFIDEQDSGAVFLDLESLTIPGLKSIRLNSTLGPILVAKAAISTDEVLSWETQNSPVPGYGGGADKLDFHGAHGVFYWELFFHLPFLVAHRLCEERNYLESQKWYHFIFNPQAPRNSAALGKENYWYCRPLLEPGDPSYEAQGLIDPDAIAYANPTHYQKTIFIAYVRCIIAHADSLYRRLTRDSLAAAKLQYIRALSLMGNAPTTQTMSHWEPCSVNDILERENTGELSALITFAQSLEVAVADLPARVEGTPELGVLKLDVFHLPTNDMLLGIWKYIDECLWNMRHNFTIDGKPMLLPLYAPRTNPLDLLRAQAGGSSGAARSVGGWRNIPHFRFRTMLASAQSGVQTLMNLGREVRQCMEQRDRGELEELQIKHMLELGIFAKTIQEETIKQLEYSEEGLKKSREVVEKRAAHYKGVRALGALALEVAADNLSLVGKFLNLASIPPDVASAVADTSPNTQGNFAGLGGLGNVTGGMKWGASLEKSGSGVRVTAAATLAAGDILQQAAFKGRRNDEWEFLQAQGEAELEVLDEQLKAQTHARNAAQASLEQAVKANAQAQAIYSFYKTRATNVELYRWLLSQMATLYFQAYDSVVGVCISAEACWQYEMGDFETRFIRPNVWMDNYHGLTAGESMSLDLLRMESAYLHRHERRLELTKTISLRDLFDAGDQTSYKTWFLALDALVDDGKLEFDFSQKLFDRDYPGHYLRQITSVSVSLPVVLGPYQNICAILTQIASTTVIKPNVDSLKYLYEPEEVLPPADILLNLRNSQQVAVSTAVDDAGMHMFNFGDERYLPFEGTGAVSLWQIEFPRHKSNKQQKALLDSVTDIIVHVRYLAMAGGSAYTNAVLERVDGLQWGVVDEEE